MRRSLGIATLVSALFAAPIWGQMRGGARGGVSMGRPGFPSHGQMVVNRGPLMANRGAFIGRPLGVQFGGNFHGRFFVSDPFMFHRFHHGHHLFVGFYPFFPGFYPWYGAYPSYYGDYSYIAGPSSYEGAYDSANAYNAANTELANAITRLSDEVERLREERESRQAPPAKPEPGKNPEPEPPQSALLVFRDKHIQEVNNYAIVGSTLWILNERRATKVPLSSLDINATTKLNEERGVEFRLPK